MIQMRSEQEMRAIAANLLFTSDENCALVSAFLYGVSWQYEQSAHIHEDELPEDYPYDAMFPFSWVDVVRLFPSEEFAKGYAAGVVGQEEESICLTDGVIDLSDQIAKYRRALRNCLAYASREKRRVNSFRAIGAEDWQHIIRFCNEVGITSSYSRFPDELLGNSEQLTASSKDE